MNAARKCELGAALSLKRSASRCRDPGVTHGNWCFIYLLICWLLFPIGCCIVCCLMQCQKDERKKHGVKAADAWWRDCKLVSQC